VASAAVRSQSANRGPNDRTGHAVAGRLDRLHPHLRAITKWYPYPFLDVTTHGYGRVIVNAVAVVAVLFVVTGLYWLGDRRLPATDRTADKAAHRTRQADRRTSEPSGY
jgi:hypothetical protein